MSVVFVCFVCSILSDHGIFVFPQSDFYKTRSLCYLLMARVLLFFFCYVNYYLQIVSMQTVSFFYDCFSNVYCILLFDLNYIEQHLRTKKLTEYDFIGF